jgi:hypothetical protein
VKPYVVKVDIGAFLIADARNLPNRGVRLVITKSRKGQKVTRTGASEFFLDGQLLDLGHANEANLRLVEDAKSRNNVDVAGLREKFGHGAEVVERALCIGDAHGTTEEVNPAHLSRMVQAVLSDGHITQLRLPD